MISSSPKHRHTSFRLSLGIYGSLLKMDEYAQVQMLIAKYDGNGCVYPGEKTEPIWINLFSSQFLAQADLLKIFNIP